MRYAMIMLERVIDTIEADEPPQWGPSPEGDEVTAVGCDETIHIGMLYVGGVFVDPEVPKPDPPKPYSPTTAELAIMETQATIYEEMTASALASAEATAEIYEAILLMGGNA